VKKRILIIALIVVGSFSGGLAVSEYRQRAAIVINYTITEYDEDGTIFALSKSVRVCNRRGEWTETQILPNGDLHTASGKVTPPNKTLASFPDARREEILGRTVAVVVDRRAELWYDPSLNQILKNILYTDETRQTVRAVIEAVEIKE
jgi:hypothetical protein